MAPFSKEAVLIFNKDILKIDCRVELEKIVEFLKKFAFDTKRDGAIIGISGGVDSALAAEVCVKAFGKEKVLGLILPEKESNPISSEYAKKQAEKLEKAWKEAVDLSTGRIPFKGNTGKLNIISELFDENIQDMKNIKRFLFW